MASENARFTAYLSQEERDGLERIARLHNTSANYVLRNAIRAFLGKSSDTNLVTRVTKVTDTGEISND